MSSRLLAGAAAVLLLAVALYVNDREELRIVQEAEASFAEAEATFANTMESASASGMRAALEGYAAAAGLLNGLAGFAGWLGQPLRLRVMHRMAAAQELLREDPEAIVAGHEALLREVRRTRRGAFLLNVCRQSSRCFHLMLCITFLMTLAIYCIGLLQGYCDAVMADALFDGSPNDHHRQHAACLAPIARGLVRRPPSHPFLSARVSVCVCACVRV